jgi:hypothetical protein
VTGYDDNHNDSDKSVIMLGGPMKSSSKLREEGISVPAVGGGISILALTAGENIDSTSLPLLNLDLPHLATMLNKANIVIKVLDAWDPLIHHSSILEVCIVLKGGGQQSCCLCLTRSVCAHLLLILMHSMSRVIVDGITNPIDTCSYELITT